MDFKQTKETGLEYLFQNYGRMDLAFSKGQGCFLYTTDGTRYLDLVAGIAVNSIGHSHPLWVELMKEQIERLTHVSNLYHIPEQAELASKIASVAPGDLKRSLFVNSGAEANEGALKVAVRYTGRNKILSALGGFHGRTAAALGATGQEVYRNSFEPLISNAFEYYEYGNCEQIKEMVGPNTAAVMVEPIQGEGGVRTASQEFFKTVRDVCTDRGALMISDEVQTGMGRTGKWFGIENHGIVPDIMTLAKGLGGGAPIGAVVTTDELASTMTPGTHGTTFGGNPLVCASGNAVFKVMKAEGLVEHSRDIGARWMDELRSVESSKILEVRGSGLMIGIEMDSPETAAKVKAHCLEKCILVNVCHGTTVRLVPPLIITDVQKAMFNEALKECL